MKKILVILAVIIMIVIIGILVMNWDDDDKIRPSGEISGPPEPVLAKDISVKSIPRENDSTRLQVRTVRPYIENLPNYSVQEVINDKIANSINPYIEELNVVSEGSTIVKANDNIVDTKQFDYHVNYERYDNHVYLSLVVLQDIRITLNSNPVGGLRSNSWKDTYVIDCDSSKEVQLKDVCDFANYKSYIVDEINKQAKNKNISLVGSTGLMDIPDTQRFYIKDNQLIIYFEPASIAPYLAGELEFVMPFTYDTTTRKFAR